MTDTTNVMLAHIQSRMNALKRKDAEFGLSAFDQPRLNELEMMLNVLKAANDLQRLAQPQAQTRLEKLVEMDERMDNPEIVFKGVEPQ